MFSAANSALQQAVSSWDVDFGANILVIGFYVHVIHSGHPILVLVTLIIFIRCVPPTEELFQPWVDPPQY
jgi:hypothetical protein